MNQKGFATIFGLCLILVFALIVKGISEAEMNHAYETADFQAEFELQNAAESAVYEAAEIILRNPNNFLEKEAPYRNRAYYQVSVVSEEKTSEHLGSIHVEAWGEKITVQPYRVSYPGSQTAQKVTEDDVVVEWPAYFVFSLAEADSERAGGKIYRRACAYIIRNDTGATIHFMELKTSNYKFVK